MISLSFSDWQSIHAFISNFTNLYSRFSLNLISGLSLVHLGLYIFDYFFWLAQQNWTNDPSIEKEIISNKPIFQS